MVKRIRPVKNLPAYCFVLAQGNTETTMGAPSLHNATGQVPTGWAFESMQNKLGEKSLSCLDYEIKIAAKQMIHQKYPPTIFF